MRVVYLVLCVVGTILPMSQFVPFFADAGLDLPLFFDESFANRVSSGAAWDLIVSSVALWVLVLTEGRRLGMKLLWLPLVANVAVGLSLALPLFLYVRHPYAEVRIAADANQ